MNIRILGSALGLLFCSLFLSAQTPKAVPVLRYNGDYDMYGFIDSASGKTLIPAQYDGVSSFYEGIAVVYHDSKYGAINTQGKVIVPLKYDAVGNCSEGMIYVNLDSKFGFVNKTGALVIPIKYAGAGSFSDGLAPVKLDNGKWGYINKTGVMLIPARYDEAGDFDRGYALAKTGESQAILDKSGKQTYLLQGLEVLGHSGGGAFVVKSIRGKYGMIDKTGKVVLDTVYSFISGWESYYENKYLRITADGLAGWVDLKGNIVFPPRFKNSDGLHNDSLRAVQITNAELSKQEWHIVNLRSRKIITIKGYDKIHPFSDGMAKVELDGSVGYLDLTGNEKIAPIFQAGSDFKDGLGIVVQDGRMMLINKNNVIVSDTFDFIIHLEKKLYAVNNGGQANQENGIDGGLYGLLDRNGKSITAVKFDYLEDFAEGSGAARTMTGEVIGIVRLDGSEKSFPNYIYVSEFEEGMAAFYEGGFRDAEGKLQGGKFGFMNDKGEILIPARFDNGNYFSEGLSVVYVGDSTFIIDRTGKKILDMTQWEDCGSGFFEGRLVVKSKESLVGYIDKTGKLVIPCIYEDAWDFKDGCALVKTKEGDYLVLDKAGKVLKTNPSSGYY